MIEDLSADDKWLEQYQDRKLFLAFKEICSSAYELNPHLFERSEQEHPFKYLEIELSKGQEVIQVQARLKQTEEITTLEIESHVFAFYIDRIPTTNINIIKRFDQSLEEAKISIFCNEPTLFTTVVEFQLKELRDFCIFFHLKKMTSTQYTPTFISDNYRLYKEIGKPVPAFVDEFRSYMASYIDALKNMFQE